MLLKMIIFMGLVVGVMIWIPAPGHPDNPNCDIGSCEEIMMHEQGSDTSNNHQAVICAGSSGGGTVFDRDSFWGKPGPFGIPLGICVLILLIMRMNKKE